MASIRGSILPRNIRKAIMRENHAIRVSPRLIHTASLPTEEVLSELETTAEGLTEEEAQRRLEVFGPNVVTREERFTRLRLFMRACLNPLVILLSVLAIISFATAETASDLVGGTLMVAMVVLGVSLRFIQEARADAAAAKLKAMIRVTATVVRGGNAQEIALAELVSGDIVKLAAGDMIPADIRILSCKDLFLIQASLTGESFPVEKFDVPEPLANKPPLEIRNICFLGASVESGSATAVVIETGLKTYLGTMASAITQAPPPTSFDKGVSAFTWLMIRFMAVMVPLVFLINGFSKHNWGEAFLFALAVAVGLTPEMLPMIVSVCLSKGRHADVAQKSHRQAAQLDPEPRRDGRSVHGQNRHTDDGPRHTRTVLRRGPEGGRGGVGAGFPQQPLPDRFEERSRPRGAAASGDSTRTSTSRTIPKWTRFLSTSAAR